MEQDRKNEDREVKQEIIGTGSRTEEERQRGTGKTTDNWRKKRKGTAQRVQRKREAWQKEE